MRSLEADFCFDLAQPARTPGTEADQFICHILQDNEEHAKLPDFKIAQVNTRLKRDARADHLQFKLSAVTGPTRQAINTYAVALLFDLFLPGSEIGITDSDTSNKAC